MLWDSQQGSGQASIANFQQFVYVFSYQKRINDVYVIYMKVKTLCLHLVYGRVCILISQDHQ